MRYLLLLLCFWCATTTAVPTFVGRLNNADTLIHTIAKRVYILNDTRILTSPELQSIFNGLGAAMQQLRAIAELGQTDLPKAEAQLKELETILNTFDTYIKHKGIEV